MKCFVTVMFILFTTACGGPEVNTGEETSADTMNTTDITSVTVFNGDTLILLPDTVILDGYTLYLTPGGNTFFNCYSLQNAFWDSIKDDINNSQYQAILWEHHSLQKYNTLFSINDTLLTLYLDNGKMLSLPRMQQEPFDTPSRHFYHYFPETDCILLYAQYYEGNAYTLVNRKTGYIINISGRPYFSPDKKHLLTASIDLEAHYSYNGLEYYAVEQDTLRKLFSYEPKGWWGPEDVEWSSDSTSIIKAGYVLSMPDSAIYKSKNIRLRMQHN